jgi:tetratricopeptide (TPR) repeat protein
MSFPFPETLRTINANLINSKSKHVWDAAIIIRLETLIISYCSPLTLMLLTQANTLAQSGQLTEALVLYDEYLALEPNNASAWNNCGYVLDDLGREDEAIASFDRALAINPHYPQALCNKGFVLDKMRRWSAAVVSFDLCIRIQPDFALAHCNRGNALRSMHQYDEALASFCRATDLEPNLAIAHWNESTCRLHMGDYDLGWKKHEWRWHTDALKAQTENTPRTTWRIGEPIHHKKITVWPEGGFGDAFQFIRFALTLQAEGAQVAIAAPLPLLKIFQQSFKNLDVIPMVDYMPMPECDYHCSIMSLPLMCGVTSLEEIPVSIPYLFADSSSQVLWAERLDALITRHHKRIGLAWAGNPLTGSDLERSLKLDSFLPLGAIAQAHGLQFISLQKSPPTQQLQEYATDVASQLHLLDFTDELVDWADTAALISNLDLVICCDTGVAHLAAAMGKPTWILNRYNGCWRWLTDRTDSPWYPSVRLFRQPAFGDWASVIADVNQALLQEFLHE